MTLHIHTPTLQVIEPRGLTVRRVQYHRSAPNEAAETRIHHHVFDPVGRETAQRDPRLFDMAMVQASSAANLQMAYSCAGVVLARLSVDSGFRVVLYGAAGQLLQSWDGLSGDGPRRRTEYDELLRPVTMHEGLPAQDERCVERLTYAGHELPHAEHNRCGRLIRHDDPAGTRLVSGYNLLGEPQVEHRMLLVTREVPDWPVQELARDGLVNSALPYTSSWRYDACGAQCKRKDALGNYEVMTYDVAGQVTQALLTLADGSEQLLLRETDYSAAGQVERQVWGNGVVSQFEHDRGTGHLLRSSVLRPGRGWMQDLRYEHDPGGNVVRIEDVMQAAHFQSNRRVEPARTYHHDTLYQLIAATGRESTTAMTGPELPVFIPLPGGGDDSWRVNYTQSYTYDKGGNLIALHHSNHPTRIMAVALQSNRALPQDSDGVPDFAAGFDQHGNLRALSPGGQALTWNARHQLQRVVQVARSEGEDDKEEYIYDGQGLRVRKVRSTWRGAVERIDQTLYLPGLELRTDGVSGETLAIIEGTGAHVLCQGTHHKPKVWYTLTDDLGSCVLALDADAALISVEQFYPFGGTSSWGGSNELEASYKTIRYCAKERDASGLYYYGLRYYAPWLHRWINPDHAGDIDGPNLYRFVRNNPVSLIDIKGLLPGKHKKNAAVKSTALGGTANQSLHTDEDYLLSAANSGALEGASFDLRHMTKSAIMNGPWKPAELSTLMAWDDLAPTHKLVHMVRWNSGQLLSDSAEKVFSQWDVFSTSLVDLQKLEAPNAAGFAKRHTGAIGEVGFVLKVAPQNIVGVHERDISFEAHVGMWTDPSNWQRTVDAPYGLVDYIKNSDDPDRPTRSNTLMTPKQVLEKTRYPFNYSHNEILVAGRAGLSLYQDLKPTRSIEIESIIVMPYEGGNNPEMDRFVERVSRLNPTVGVRHF